MSGCKKEQIYLYEKFIPLKIVLLPDYYLGKDETT